MAAPAKLSKPAPPAPAPKKAPSPSPQPTAAPRPLGSSPAVKPGEQKEDAAPGVMELKGQPTFAPPQPIADFLDARKKSTVNARFGKLAQGPILVDTLAKGKYRISRQAMPLVHPIFSRVAEAAPGLTPSLVFTTRDGKLTGEVGLAAGAKIDDLKSCLAKAPDLLGLAGFSFQSGPSLINAIEGGSLHVGLKDAGITVGAAFSGKITIEAIDDAVAFDGNASVNVKGLANGTLNFTRTAAGLITGKATVELTLPKNISGSVDVAWDGTVITGEGKVGYTGDKLSGEVTLRLMEKSQALQLEQAKKAPEGTPQAATAAQAKSKPSKIDYVVFGEGDLTFSFTDWLNGSAHVIVDPKGFVTIIGKITPQKEFILFEQKDYVKQLFKLEARASYGIPVVGNIFIFANVGMDVFAKLGPAKFYNIIVQGTYSTNPEVSKDFSIQGSFNFSAAAGARLRAEAGAGLEVLDHDIKAGAGINGIAGIKAYAEATPIIGYREKAAPGQDKKGEFFIRGDVEAAAQPFLGLSGDLFVEIDAPWWSPVPDKKWTWPLFNKEYPIGGSVGFLASIDYVFGSGQFPKIDLKPVEFSADKFMTDMYTDKAKAGSGSGGGDKKSTWQEKNAKAADPPPKTSPKGNMKPGKAGAPPAAKSKVQPGGSKKSKKGVNPSARTAEGKSVKQLQDEAAKKGKKPAGKEKGAPKGKEDSSKKDKAEELAKQLKDGLAALDQVTARYAKDGATKEEVITGVKSVRRKFKVFKSIEVIDGGKTWDYLYEYNPKPKKTGPLQKKDEWPIGTKEDPIPIMWFKKESTYPDVHIGSLTGRPLIGITLPKLDKTEARTLKVANSNFLKRGDRTGRKQRGNENEKNNVRIHINKMIDTKPEGQNIRFAGYTTGFAIDHVRDLTWQGDDNKQNLWPLPTKVNDAVNASHLQQVRTRKGQSIVTEKADQFPNKHFVIAKVTDAPASKGDHGTTKDNPINSGNHPGIPQNWRKNGA